VARGTPGQYADGQSSTQKLRDELYSQFLNRVYVNATGYRIMLLLAYGSDQHGSLQADKPEVCYPAQGFALQK
jgi:EpsI family protein